VFTQRSGSTGYCSISIFRSAWAKYVHHRGRLPTGETFEGVRRHRALCPAKGIDDRPNAQRNPEEFTQGIRKKRSCVQSEE